MNETSRIREAYARRRYLPPELYSTFHPGNLFIAQQCERAVLALLRRCGVASLADRRILEVGCGTGMWLRDLIRWGAHPTLVCGVDLIEGRLRQARQYTPRAGIVCADAAQLPFPRGWFDLILQATMFTSILDPEMKRHAALEMLRVVTDGGLIIWYDFRYDNPRNPDVRGIGRREIVSLFPGCRFDFRSVTLAPPLARTLAPVSWLACDLLDRIPLLRTHCLVAVRKAV